MKSVYHKPKTFADKVVESIINTIQNIKDKAENKPPKPKKPEIIDKWLNSFLSF